MSLATHAAEDIGLQTVIKKFLDGIYNEGAISLSLSQSLFQISLSLSISFSRLNRRQS